jgi:hypothetical protein
MPPRYFRRMKVQADDEQGDPRNGRLPSSNETFSRAFRYSLNTKTRVCPEKRTSFTCPFSPINTAS